MVAKKRNVEPGHVYHVLNRATNRQRLFSRDKDFDKFEELIVKSLQITPLEIFTYELMPNHWHFLVRPGTKDAVSEFFQYLSGTHSKRFRVFTETVGDGHVYQDRFKSLPVESDKYFLTLARYIERNAQRAGLVQRAEDWRWGGLWRREKRSDGWLTSEWPVPRPRNWIDFVNQPLTAGELAAVRECIQRGRPFGSPDWVREVAERLQLTHTLRRPGRPRKNPATAH